MKLPDSTHSTPLDLAAEDFVTHRPEYRGHLSTVLLHVEAIGLPYCYECHDWHQDPADHSDPSSVIVARHPEKGSAALGTMVAIACWVASMLMVSWCMVAWFAPAPPAAATRTVVGSTQPDLCDNRPGHQTLDDVRRAGYRIKTKTDRDGYVTRRVCKARKGAQR